MIHFKMFLAVWLFLAFFPLFSSIIFDFSILNILKFNNQYLGYTLIVILPIFILSFSFFLSISLWIVFKLKIYRQRKIILILSTYLLVWLVFTNIYFFLSNLDNFFAYTKILVAEQNTLSLETPLLKSNLIHGLQNFWGLTAIDNQLMPINRLLNYIDCLYFSGSTILTIGYGDFYPLHPLLKLLAIFEGFLGMIINVLAVGLWLSNTSNPTPPAIKHYKFHP